jgi:hypothetical protein
LTSPSTDGEVPDPQRASSVLVTAPQCPQSSQQFVHIERFSQIVLRARVQPIHPIRGIAQCGENQHGRQYAAMPEPGEKIEAVDGRQFPVQDEDVVVASQPQVRTTMTVRGDVHRIALLGEQGASRPAIWLSSSTNSTRADSCAGASILPSLPEPGAGQPLA